MEDTTMIHCKNCDYYCENAVGAFCLEKERACPKDNTLERCCTFTVTDLRWRCENFNKCTKLCKLTDKPCTQLNKPWQCSAFVNGTRYGLDRVQEAYMAKIAKP